MISLHLFRVMDAQLIRHGSAAHVLWWWMWVSMTLVYRIPFWSRQIVLDHFCSRPPHRRTFAGALWNLLLSWVLNELHPDTLLWGKLRFVIRRLLKENSIIILGWSFCIPLILFNTGACCRDFTTITWSSQIAFDLFRSHLPSRRMLWALGGLWLVLAFRRAVWIF